MKKQEKRITLMIAFYANLILASIQDFNPLFLIIALISLGLYLWDFKS